VFDVNPNKRRLLLLLLVCWTKDPEVAGFLSSRSPLTSHAAFKTQVVYWPAPLFTKQQNLEKLSSIKDRGQIDRVTALASDLKV